MIDYIRRLFKWIKHPVYEYDEVTVSIGGDSYITHEVGEIHESVGDTVSKIKHDRRRDVIILEYEEGQGDIWIPDHNMVNGVRDLEV